MAETEIADADTLRDLREIAIKAYLAHPHAKDAGCMVDPMEAAVAAVLSAAKPYIDVKRVDIQEKMGSDEAVVPWLDSRIRYLFELPQTGTLRVPVDVDGLVKAVRRAYWKDSCGDIDDRWRDAARAALDYLNIEPCPAPEYNPDDVALTLTRDEMAQIVYRAGWCQSYVWDDNDGGSERKQIYAEADAILDAISRRRCVALTPIERAELENLRAECKRLRTRQRREWTQGDEIELGYEILEVFRNVSVAETDFWQRTGRAALAWFDGKRGVK